MVYSDLSAHRRARSGRLTWAFAVSTLVAALAGCSGTGSAAGSGTAATGARRAGTVTRVVDGDTLVDLEAFVAIDVRDTGVGLIQAGHAAPSPTTGSGTGLANIRERLQLLFGDRAKLQLSSVPEGGTLATLILPYQVQPSAPSTSPSRL